jgi:hypothetical protein
MSAARRAKGPQVAETVLRDKDPEWFQTREVGPSSTVRKTRQVGKVLKPAEHTRPHGQRPGTPSSARC